MELPAAVLVTPNETDARVGLGFLNEAGIVALARPTLTELSSMPLASIGCAVLVEEALVHSEVSQFLLILSAQPAWSDLPLVLIASESTSPGVLVEVLFPYSGNVAVLKRPLNPVSLITSVKVGLRARQRQLEVRDLLEQRQDALSRRDEFLAMLAHELRNPLAPLRNAVYIMKQVDLHDPLLQDTRDLIDRQTAHLKRLVDDLLEVSRLELGKVDLQKKLLDLNASIASAADAVLPLATLRGQTIEVELSAQPLHAVADPVRVEQIVSNLLTNAVKFTGEGGRILVQGLLEEHNVGLVVRDDGIGLRSDMLERIFDLFTQDKQSLARAGGGLGIGLTIVKRLVELHGGFVTAASEGPGRGTTFTVRFPRAMASSEPVSPLPGRAAPVPTAKRVLVVEDNPDIRDSLSTILRMWGNQVEYAANGRDGLKCARDIKPDLALIDIGLPELDGYEVARAIRGEPFHWAKAMKLIALTGYGRDVDRERALEAGFDMHLVKPLDPEALAEAIRASDPDRASASDAARPI
jgi:signal transduction histidine kinase/CheY-like chemotaxis protein